MISGAMQSCRFFLVEVIRSWDIHGRMLRSSAEPEDLDLFDQTSEVIAIEKAVTRLYQHVTAGSSGMDHS